jgi:TnpA family transposase
LALYAIGSNTGLKRMSAANGDISYADLRYIKRKFITVANVKAATAEVVNKILEIRDPRIWGESTTSVICDSKRINAWDQNLMTEWHPRYKNKGIMVYWHVERRAVCVNSNAKNCFSSEVGSMYKGILEHCTNMEINQAYMDTHGQSTFGFGVGAFIHVDLFPRLKNINKQKLYYPSSESKKDYPNLQKILKAPINWEQIANDYHEAVKHAVALKLGIVEPDVMVKRFSNDNYEHPVYKVFTEVGKASKTIFLCNYIQSEELRIEIHEALNIVERVNSIMGFIFYGKLGEISTNFRIDQELAIACLHLLQVCMGYINTIIHQEILLTPEWEGVLTEEDKRALNILFHANINPYGLFPLNLDTRLGVPVFNNKIEDTSESEFMLEEID